MLASCGAASLWLASYKASMKFILAMILAMKFARTRVSRVVEKCATCMHQACAAAPFTTAAFFTSATCSSATCTSPLHPYPRSDQPPRTLSCARSILLNMPCLSCLLRRQMIQMVLPLGILGAMLRAQHVHLAAAPRSRSSAPWRLLSASPAAPRYPAPVFPHSTSLLPSSDICQLPGSRARDECASAGGSSRRSNTRAVSRTARSLSIACDLAAALTHARCNASLHAQPAGKSRLQTHAARACLHACHTRRQIWRTCCNASRACSSSPVLLLTASLSASCSSTAARSTRVCSTVAVPEVCVSACVCAHVRACVRSCVCVRVRHAHKGMLVSLRHEA